ncbi:aromatic motif membrane protein [Mycoplasma sp. 31_09]|uniref:aromatic motif membrane protein n=1 Tax=unclassified Mycoplasma TaxID=2683645 RepID=UPI003AACF882
MKTKWKILTILGFAPLGFATVSCSNYEQGTKLNAYIDYDKDTSPAATSAEALSHQKIMNQLLSLVYKNTPEAQNAKEIYLLKQQQDQGTILAKFTQIASEYKKIYKSINIGELEAKINRLNSMLVFLRGDKKRYQETLDEIKSLQSQIDEAKNNKPAISALDYLAQYKELINQNWYFILNNLDKFDWDFVSMAFNPYEPTSKKKMLTDEYINNANKQKPFTTLNFKDSYLDDIKLGDESSEIGDNDAYYIKKDKLVFRIMIRNISSNISQVDLSFVGIYFGAAQAKTISLNLISQTIHSGFIHDYESGLKQYQEDMPVKQRYGYPAFVFPFGKEQNEKVTENNAN